MKRIVKMFVMAALLMISGQNFAQSKHQYVDLGLPSGTLWATCNVGADYPWEYGNYYAWGETKTKTNYNVNWSNYKYAKGERKLTKYCSDRSYGNNGFTDKLTKLQPGDDVATAQWGSGWCMPTKEQWQELMQSASTSKRTELNGVRGWLFIGTNGNQLFLPAAGGRDDAELERDGRIGLYWSSSLYTDNPSWAKIFDFGSEDCSMGADSRYSGRSVRAVRSARQN